MDSPDLGGSSLTVALSRAEATRRFPANGMGHATQEECFGAVAIHRMGERMPNPVLSPHLAGSRSMFEALNRGGVSHARGGQVS